jgi:hypothetical protein
MQTTAAFRLAGLALVSVAWLDASGQVFQRGPEFAPQRETERKPPSVIAPQREMERKPPGIERTPFPRSQEEGPSGRREVQGQIEPRPRYEPAPQQRAPSAQLPPEKAQRNPELKPPTEKKPAKKEAAKIDKQREPEPKPRPGDK